MLVPLLTTLLALAQTAAFEVASIKPVPPEAAGGARIAGGPGTADPGQLNILHISLDLLIGKAFELEESQITGLLSSKQRYDIIAKIPPGSTRAQVNEMLQRLLAERFGLAFHWVSKERSIYELVVARGGAKFEAAEKPGGTPRLVAQPSNGVTQITAKTQPLANLLQFLKYQIDRPVTDLTGLTGVYDFTLTYSAARQQQEVSDPGHPDLFGAFERQLGLQFRSKKGAVRTLVVDHVNTAVTEN